MSTYTHDSANVNATDLVLTKLREVNSDTVQYILPGHAVGLPQTATVSSVLPKPNANFAGVTRTKINLSLAEKLNEGTDNEQLALVVAKLDLSFPIGTSAAKRREVGQLLASVLLSADGDYHDLTYIGKIPG